MKLVIADDMESEVVEGLRAIGTVDYKPKDLKAALADADALVVRSATKVTKDVVDAAKRLKVVARAGVGLDNVDAEYCKLRGVKVLNTPGASANAVAELAIGLMIGALRNVQRAHHEMKGGVWNKKALTGREIEGRTLGIIGYGRIGGMVGRKAHALGMKVIAYSPPPRHEDGIVRYVDSLDAFLPQCDVISIHTILTPETKHMINGGTLAKMKSGAVLINLARGEIVDEGALYEACKAGKISAAALDVYEKEPYAGKLLELDNVFLTPHIGAATKEAQARIGKELVELLKKELKG